MLAEELGQKIEAAHRADLEKRGGERWPARTNIASQIGHPCARRMYFKRTAWDQARPFGPDAIERMDAGDQWGEATVRRLMDLGFAVEETEVRLDWKEYQIAGKADIGALRERNVRDSVPAEIKSVTRWAYNKLGSVQDMLESSSVYHRLYPHQLNLYLLMRDKPSGLFILRDREGGGMRLLPAALDLDLGEECLRRAETVNKAIEAGEPPDVIEWSEWCEACDFREHCRHPELRAGPLDVITDEEILDMLREREELALASKRYGQIDKAIKKYMKAKVEGSAIAGDFKITIKDRTRKGYTVEPGEYQVVDITRWKEAT
jgi:CRISPR/Cas system-associated exonuclease Cas4 (RecB family)